MRTNEVDKESIMRSRNPHGLADAIEDKRPESEEIERLTREFLERGGVIQKLGGCRFSESFDPVGNIAWRDRNFGDPKKRPNRKGTRDA